MADRIRKINAQVGDVHGVIVANTSFAASARIDGIDISANGTIYGVDFTNQIVYKIYEDGRILGAVAGKLSTTGTGNASTNNANDGNAAGGQNARFSSPFGICVDQSDNIFVTDQANKLVRRVSPHGRTVTLAGSGSTGDALNDNGLLATFSAALSGICVDKAGVLYVADTNNHKIKKIWPSGKVGFLAGSQAGFTNAVGGSARFNAPKDVCVDPQGNVYVADSSNNCIRKITESGVVSICAGGASGAGSSGLVDSADPTAVRFNNPIRIAMDPSGNFMYVMDYGNYAIRKVYTSGKTTTFMRYNRQTLPHEGDLCVDKSGVLYVLENNT